jgi:hypothetical protein
MHPPHLWKGHGSDEEMGDKRRDYVSHVTDVSYIRAVSRITSGFRSLVFVLGDRSYGDDMEYAEQIEVDPIQWQSSQATVYKRIFEDGKYRTDLGRRAHIALSPTSSAATAGATPSSPREKHSPQEYSSWNQAQTTADT